MSEIVLTTVPRDLYYHEVEYVRGLESALRSIELDVDGLNTKGYKQQKNTQAALDRIKAKCRAGLNLQ